MSTGSKVALACTSTLVVGVLLGVGLANAVIDDDPVSVQSGSSIADDGESTEDTEPSTTTPAASADDVATDDAATDGSGDDAAAGDEPTGDEPASGDEAAADDAAAPTDELPEGAISGASPDLAAFAETFDTPASMERFEIEVHHRIDHDPQGAEGRLKETDWGGDHDLECGSPDTQRPLNGYTSSGAVDRADGGDRAVLYHCREHFMTSMGDVNGWSAISLSPHDVFPNVWRVCWDQNVTDLGGRQWTQVVVTPVEGGLLTADGEHALSHTSPVNGGPDRTGALMTPETVAVVLGPNSGRLTGFSEITEQGFALPGADTEGVASKAIRRQHCMTDLGDGNIEVRVDQGDGVDDRVLVFPGSFPTDARVVFEDHTYNPDKDGAPVGYTWHWDNFFIWTAP